MRNLLDANFARIFKSRSFLIGVIASFVLPLIVALFISGGTGKLSAVISTSLVGLPMIISAVVGLFVEPEFTHGTIRNKLIRYKQEDIYMSLFICLSCIALMFLAAFLISTFTFGLAILGIESISVKAVAVAIILMIILDTTSVALSLFVCMIIHGGKGLALLLLLQYALCLLGLDYGVEDNAALSIVSRCVPQGQISAINLYNVPDKPWLTVICSALLGALTILLGIYYFKKSDIK